MRHDHYPFLRFDDEAGAKVALTRFWTGDDWRRDMVDGPVPVVDGGGEVMAGHFLNIALPALDLALPGLTGAGFGPADDFTLVFGEHPSSPQRVFA